MSQWTVKEHYIPQFYLKSWAEDGHTLYESNLSSNSIYKIKTEDICYKDNYYENKIGNEFIKRNELENLLSIDESKSALRYQSIINNIRNCLKNGKRVELYKNDVQFLIQLYVKVYLRNYYNEKYLELVDSYNLIHSIMLSTFNEIDYESYRRHLYQQNCMPKSLTVKSLYDNFYKNYYLFIVYSKKGNFITTNYPFYSNSIHGVCYMPLSPNMGLLMLNKANHLINKLNNTIDIIEVDANEYNKKLLSTASLCPKIYARNKNIIKKMKKYISNKNLMHSRYYEMLMEEYIKNDSDNKQVYLTVKDFINVTEEPSLLLIYPHLLKLIYTTSTSLNILEIDIDYNIKTICISIKTSNSPLIYKENVPFCLEEMKKYYCLFKDKLKIENLYKLI